MMTAEQVEIDSETIQAPLLRAYVHLGYGFAAESYRQRFAEGRAPDQTPYGFHHAEAMGCSVTYSTDHAESRPAAIVRRGLQRVLGFDLVHALRNRRQLDEAEVIWTMEERQYLAVLFLSLLLPSLRRKKVIAQTVWLFDKWSQASSLRRWLYARLLRQAACLTVHSRNYLAHPALRELALKAELLPFGVSAESFPAGRVSRETHCPIRVLAMGTDPTRDWTTFLEAFGRDPRFEAIGISAALTEERIKAYPNVRVLRNPSMDEFRECYRWADYVVVPMTGNLYSGITVALEAGRMGVPVVCSRTGGVPTYFSDGEVLYVPVADPTALQQAVLGCSQADREALVARAQRRIFEDDYSTQGMARRYVELSRRLVGT